MKISIIIPVYNVEPYIEKCLRSVMNQTFQGELECIVVDDCGSDESMLIVERVISNYDGPVNFNVLHHERNRGLSAARNTGMAIATGDYLFFLDSDDWLNEEGIAVLAEGVVSSNADVIVGDLEYVDDKGEKYSYPYSLKMADGTFLEGDAVMNNYLCGWNMMAQNKLYKRKFIESEKLKFKEGLVYEDQLWSYEVACVAKSLFAIKKITYFYLKRDNGIMGSSKRYRSKHYITKVKEMGAFLRERRIDRKRPLLMVNAYFSHTLYDYVGSLKEYISVYIEMRREHHPSVGLLLKTIGVDIKWYVRDIHFFFPTIVAPLWMWLTYTFPVTLIKKV